jgi:hypothetical protein
MRWIFLMSIVSTAACTATGSEGAKPVVPAAVPARLDSSTASLASASSAVESSASDTAAVRFDVTGHPVLPAVLRDYCEGADCGTHFAVIACLPTGLREAPSDTSAITIPLAEGDSAKVIRRDLRVLSPGIVVVKSEFVLDQEAVEAAEGDVMAPRSDTVRLARGDTVYLINYLALGRWSWAYHGRLHASDEFWAAAPEGGLGGAGRDSTHAIARSTPVTEDWWLAQTPRASGWWHGDGHQELQSISGMEHWSDDCNQVRKRSSTDSSSEAAP